MTRFASALLAAADPLGPTGQDPDGPRDLACDLTASQRVCAPAQPRPEDPPDLDVVDAAAVAGGASALSTVLAVVLVVALIAALAWLVAVLVRQRRPSIDDIDQEDFDEDLDGGVLQQRIVDDEQPPQRWRRLAAEHRDAGRFRDAVRCEYRALVGDLARAGYVDEIPGRTSGEERTQLRHIAPSVASTFDEAADLFDTAWFDDAPTPMAADERFQAAARAVLDDVLARR